MYDEVCTLVSERLLLTKGGTEVERKNGSNGLR
jgi:hypothetical protein